MPLLAHRVLILNVDNVEDTTMDELLHLDLSDERDKYSLPQESSMLDKAHREDALDEALRCTFPASDPIALNFRWPRSGFGSVKDLQKDIHKKVVK
jgi:hypothetical protein